MELAPLQASVLSAERFPKDFPTIDSITDFKTDAMADKEGNGVHFSEITDYMCLCCPQ